MPLDINEDEPENVGEAVRRLGLKHIVITSVTRDDLFDGGAGVFAKTIASIRKNASPVIIEVLIPDFKGRAEFIKTVVDACPKIISHNLETVPSLYNKVRPMADYRISLDVLRMAKQLGETKEIYTKSAIMLGLGETEEEVISLFYDLRSVRCDFLSIGQYLAPSKNHFPVKSFIAPEKFDEYKDIALKVGFLYVASGPYVRSSYLASEYISKKDEVMV
jgi:lipoic acid synthetase